MVTGLWWTCCVTSPTQVSKENGTTVWQSELEEEEEEERVLSGGPRKTYIPPCRKTTAVSSVCGGICSYYVSLLKSVILYN